jgi:hypothetical protein
LVAEEQLFERVLEAAGGIGRDCGNAEPGSVRISKTLPGAE